MKTLEQIIIEAKDKTGLDLELKFHGKRCSMIVFHGPGKAKEIASKTAADLIKKIIKHYDV